MSKRKANPSKEQEVLNSPVNLTGSGEDPAVKAMLSDSFIKGTNQEALDIALAMQQLIRGQNSLLENQQEFSEQVSKIRKRMDDMDKAAERWNTDRENFIQEVLDRSEKLKLTGNMKDRLMARGGEMLTAAINEARAQQVTENISFDEELRRMEQVPVVSPGELVMVMEGGRQVAKMMNETVKIKHRKWVLPIGKVVYVPLAVQKVLDERRRTQQETEAREKILASNLESSQLDQQWKKVNSEFNSTTDTLPTA